MNYKQHIAVGFAAAALALWGLVQAGFLQLKTFFDPVLAAELFLATLLFSVLPDIDARNSKVSGALQFLLLAAAAFGAGEFLLTKNPSALAKTALAIPLLIAHFLYAKSGRKHRRFPHSPVFGALACVAVFVLTGSKTVAFAGAVAFASHLIADEFHGFP